MVDLNLWQLAYDDVVLDFGTHESGHPFVRQVKVGAVDLENTDSPHPLTDGLVFGLDVARGRVLDFVGAHLSSAPLPADRKWVAPMDDAGVFEGAWRARSVRRKAGAVATCANLDRGRLAYGRPRPYEADHELVRHGWLVYGAQFVTVDDRFYSTVEHVRLVGVEPGSPDAFAFPVAFPHQGTTPTETRGWIENAGTDDTWPILTFRRGGNPKAQLHDAAGGVAWTLEVDDNLGADDELVIDTHPWVRTVKLNGSSRPGLLRGSRLEECWVPPGISEMTYTAADPTGLAEVEVRWRDAFTSL